MPKVSAHGVAFDHTEPDKYTYLKAVLELLDALSYGETKVTQHLYKTDGKSISSRELTEKLKKYITNLETLIQKRDADAEVMIEKLIDRVKKNTTLSPDERIAWLGNIEIMKEYYIQYITNQTAYDAAMVALGDEIHDSHIKEVKVPMFRNYGIVLNDLVATLEHRKVPINAKVEILSSGEGIVVTVSFLHL